MLMVTNTCLFRKILLNKENTCIKIKSIKSQGFIVYTLQHVGCHACCPDEPQVRVANFSAAIEPWMKAHIQPLIKQLIMRKRVGVLISGSGSNLQVCSYKYVENKNGSL